MSQNMASNVRVYVGRVIELEQKYKAIVEFKLEKKNERALLMHDKFKVKGELLPEGGSLTDHIEVGTLLKFICHPFDDKGVDRCGWYILSAWIHMYEEYVLGSNTVVMHGLHNCTGEVSKLAKRQGVLCYNNKGTQEYVMFLASKVFTSGKRISAKANLDQLQCAKEGRKLCFDAVPCEPTDNNNCVWFATVVWKGRKPVMEYDDVRTTRNKPAKLPQLTEMKLIASNPHMLFLRSVGQVVKILNEEFGLALALLQNNHWELVLFHRSVAMLFDLSLANEDLTKVFKEGDRLRIVAASTSKFGVQWIASQIRIFVDPSISHLYQF